jgi:hypothetical protein
VHAPTRDVQHGTFGIRERMGQLAGRLRRDARDPGRSLRRVAGRRGPQRALASQVLAEPPRPYQVLLEQHVDQRQQHQDIRAWTDKDVLGDGGGLTAPRIDDHHAASPLAQRLEPPAHVRRRHQAAVGHQRVRADADEQAGAIDVRHRQ